MRHDPELFVQTTRRLAHLRSIAAPMASLCTAALTLLNAQYRLAARLNLDLAPLRDMAPLPEQCPTCEQHGVFSDRWHCLICAAHQIGQGGVARRHHAVNRALCETAWTLGGQADMEVQGLLPGSRLRPDLRVVFHGEYLLSDVQINHPLASSHVQRVAAGMSMIVGRAVARLKRRKYERMRRHVGATFIPFVAESLGGLSDDSLLLVGRMADAAQQHMQMWTKEQIVRHVLCNVAVAIQRENAATVLAGHATIDFRRRGPDESDYEGETDEDEGDDDRVEVTEDEDGDEEAAQQLDDDTEQGDAKEDQDDSQVDERDTA